MDAGVLSPANSIAAVFFRFVGLTSHCGTASELPWACVGAARAYVGAASGEACASGRCARGWLAAVAVEPGHGEAEPAVGLAARKDAAHGEGAGSVARP
jgi:hypothetical protein